MSAYSRIHHWKETAELLGLAAILAGLYFVYSEIQQTA